MHSYEISKRENGEVIGVYYADSELEALERIAKDAGYESYAEACNAKPEYGEVVIITT